jgi:hypothetical protein
MRNLIRVLSAALLLSLLAACASAPQKQASKQTLAEIKTIVILRPPEPKTYAAMYFTGPASLFGAIGGLIAAGDISKKQDTLTAAFKVQNYSFCPRVADKIAANLTAMGYQARAEDGPWEEYGAGYKFHPEKLKTDADATMILVPGLTGFVAQSTFHDYLPTMVISAKLVGRDGKEELYLTKNVVGWEPKFGDWRMIPAKTRFANFDALMADVPATAQSLMDAGDAIVLVVTEDFKR